MQIKTEAGKAHEIKNPAIAFGIYGQGAKRLGDVAVTSKGLVWSNGKKAKDVTVKWDAFINWMQSQLAGAKVVAPKTAAAKMAKSAKAGKSTAKSAKANTAQTAKARKAISATRKAMPIKKGLAKLNGRSAASARMPAIASRAKPAHRTAH